MRGDVGYVKYYRARDAYREVRRKAEKAGSGMLAMRAVCSVGGGLLIAVVASCRQLFTVQPARRARTALAVKGQLPSCWSATATSRQCMLAVGLMQRDSPPTMLV